MEIVLCCDMNWLFSEEAFSIYAACMYQPTYEDYKVQMDRFASDASVKIFVCETCGEKTGILVLKHSDTTPEIVGIAVAERYRHHGMGRTMIRQVMDSEHLNKIRAQTDDDAIGFYRKCGFSEERTVIRYPDGFSVRYHCLLNR